MLTTNEAIRFRMKLLALFAIPAAALLLWRFYVVQVRKHDYYFSEAKARYTATTRTSGKRGEIFDVHGHLLVGNAPCVEITCAPCNLKNDVQRRKLAFLMQKYFGGDVDNYYRRLAPEVPRRDSKGKVITGPDGRPVLRPNQYMMVARNAPLDVAAAFREQTRSKSNNLGAALYYSDTTMRTYPKGRLLANVLGYINVVNDSDIPQGGLEKQLNRQITPGEGQIVYERTRDGAPLLYGFREFRESHDGKNVYLTISEPIQAILEEELDAAYAEWQPETLYAAIADPRTGNILAMAQRPNFDPNDRSTFAGAAIGTRIAADAFEPGSIAKPFTIGKALDWNFVTPGQTISCDRGLWYYAGKAMRDSHPYDALTVAGIIQKSSNIGTAKIALMLGDKLVYQALNQFGFGSKTGLPLAGEHPGLLRSPERWDKLTATRVAIGYSMLVSPLQLLRAYCALANGGRLPQLRLVDRIEDPETGEVVPEPIHQPVQMFRNPEAHRQLVEMMTLVTQPGGTATRAAIPGYLVAGKTGTSRKHIAHQGYSTKQYYASFVGFVPAQRPELVMLVTFDSPRNATYGGVVAAPVFRKTAERVLKYLNVQPDPVSADAAQGAATPQPAMPIRPEVSGPGGSSTGSQPDRDVSAPASRRTPAAPVQPQPVRNVSAPAEHREPVRTRNSNRTVPNQVPAVYRPPRAATPRPVSDNGVYQPMAPITSPPRSGTRETPPAYQPMVFKPSR